jgi:signal transduction histidine kinase
MDRTGLGLGLNISRQAIEADGGRLSVRNLPDKGCVFVVEMPLATADAIGG